MTAAKSNLLPVDETWKQIQRGIIPLDLLDENPRNPRRTFDAAALEGLAQSIRTSGILQPLLVRPKPLEEGLIEQRYEIVAGARRSKAAEMAGLLSVPCNVRLMTDAEAADAAFIDNKQRVDVHALEEAEAFGKLLNSHGSIEAVAAQVGVDVAHVTKRLKLRDLGVWQVEALRKGLITIDHALLLTRLGVEEQNEALKWCLDPHAGVKTPVEKQIEISAKLLANDGSHRSWEPESVIRLKEHIEQSSGRKLSRAPWDIDDALLLPQAGACTVCPQNTKANVGLFGDLDIDVATCSDGRCFELKRAAFVQIKLTHAGMPPGSAIRLSWRPTQTEPRMELGEPCDGPKGLNNFTRVPNLKQVFKVGQWIEAKKGSCPNVLTGVTIDWSDVANRGLMNAGDKLKKPGQVIPICIAAKCKAHRKEWEKLKSENTNGGRQENEPERKAREEKERLAALAETKFRVRLAAEAVEKIKALPEKVLRAMLLAVLPRRREHLEAYASICPGLIKALETAKLDSIEFARAVATASLEEGHILVPHYYEPRQFRKEFIEQLKALGYDASKAWEKPEKQGSVVRCKGSGKAVEPAPAKAATAKKAATKSAREKIAKAVKGLTPAATKRAAVAQKKRRAVNVEAMAKRKAVKK